MPDRRYVAISVILIATVGFIAVIINSSVFYPSGFVASAEATYWQNFMPMVPEEGPPFYIVVYVNITNIGSERITGLEIPQVTVFYHSTGQFLVTLSLHQIISVWSEVGPGQSILVQLTNDRDTIFSPTIEEGTLLFSQVLLRWGNGSYFVLTTPPSKLLYTF